MTDPMAWTGSEPVDLIADIGGTNARFAILSDKGPQAVHVLQCAHYAGLEPAIEAYRQAVGLTAPLRRVALSVACHTDGDLISLTNNAWSFSQTIVREMLNLEQLIVLNDFTALALGIPELTAEDRYQVGGGEVVPRAPIAIVGPGTGLGVSGLVHTGQGWTALSTEGGHVSMAAVTDRESDVLRLLRAQMGHVSAERVISGMGLKNLYMSLCMLDKKKIVWSDPADITRMGLSGECETCREALEMFCAMLGTVAGNLALSLGSRGGVYIAGGIVPRLGTFFAHSPFRRRFEEKGRMTVIQMPIPTYVVTHAFPAFLGLEAALRRG